MSALRNVAAASVLGVLLFPYSLQAAVIVDNDDGTPAYVETGAWSTSTSTGYDGGTYRWTSPGGSKTATWTADLPAAGPYEVFVWYRPGSNRTTSTKYDIHAADQTHTVYRDQRSGGFVWESLGTFTFDAGSNTITLDAGGSSGGTAVIADAVRFGGESGGACTLVSTEEVATGVQHSVYECPAPQVLHVLEFDLADPKYTVQVGYAHGQRNFPSREPTSQIADRYDTVGKNVVAAINASHFDAGVFIHGMQGTGGNIVGYPTQTWPKEAYVLEESGEAFVVSNAPAANSTVYFADGAALPANVLNYTCTSDTLAVYTPDWGATTGSTSEGVAVIVEGVSYPWRPNKLMHGRITEVRTGAMSVNPPIPADGFVLAACPGAESQLLAHAAGGDAITARIELSPADLINAKEICGGASGWLVKDGAPYPENWNYGHAPDRHPRTALAWSGTRHWFVTCDGRQLGYSVGMTYTELADFLVNSLEVDHAVNLDGGGSTAMVIDGMVVNCPSDNASTPCTGTERAVPNGILLVERDAKTAAPLVDTFTSDGRALSWDDKFGFNLVVPFAPAAPGGDGYVLELVNADGGYETASVGAAGDTGFTVVADIYCEYRPDVAADGFERVGIFTRDNGNANFEAAEFGGGNCYALTYDTDTGRIRAGIVVDGEFADFLEAEPLFAPSTAWREFRVSCSGDQIRYFVDGNSIANVVDTTHPAGRFGIGHHEYFATNANVHGTRADNFRAYEVDFDFDGDGDVDLIDYRFLALCMTYSGPGQSLSPEHNCIEDYHTDLDGDLDVDLADCAVFQAYFLRP